MITDNLIMIDTCLLHIYQILRVGVSFALDFGLVKDYLYITLFFSQMYISMINYDNITK